MRDCGELIRQDRWDGEEMTSAQKVEERAGERVWKLRASEREGRGGGVSRNLTPVTSVNRDRAAAGLQVYRTDNAARSIGLSEMQRRG